MAFSPGFIYLSKCTPGLGSDDVCCASLIAGPRRSGGGGVFIKSQRIYVARLIFVNLDADVREFAPFTPEIRNASRLPPARVVVSLSATQFNLETLAAGSVQYQELLAKPTSHLPLKLQNWMTWPRTDVGIPPTNMNSKSPSLIALYWLVLLFAIGESSAAFSCAHWSSSISLNDSGLIHTRAIPVTESTAFNVSVAVGAVGVFTCVLAIVLLSHHTNRPGLPQHPGLVFFIILAILWLGSAVPYGVIHSRACVFGSLDPDELYYYTIWVKAACSEHLVPPLVLAIPLLLLSVATSVLLSRRSTSREQEKHSVESSVGADTRVLEEQVRGLQEQVERMEAARSDGGDSLPSGSAAERGDVARSLSGMKRDQTRALQEGELGNHSRVRDVLVHTHTGLNLTAGDPSAPPPTYESEMLR
ncbi:hypothetical protein C8J57DRAFT_1563062 [Mycena rebaudengoi]|nr:hypothetical protein C8J57DRAFT_1563062 [Mycena rebaudengoi]